MSALVAVVLAGGVFSGMQLYRHVLASSGPLTVLGGALGALLFVFLLTVRQELHSHSLKMSVKLIGYIDF